AFEPVVGLEPVAEGLGAPVDLMPPGDGSGRLFIVDQIGVIRILTAEGQLLDEPFLDIRDRMIGLRSRYDERGLLGLAFHPDFRENGRFYVYYSAPLSPEAPQGWNHTSHLSRFTVSETDENAADFGSEQVILRVHQPQSNHDGGKIAFGPDGMLYVALGDGGGGNDVGTGHVEDWYEANRGGNGQDVTDNLLGSVLRIDVDGGDPYAVPEDNPFVGREGLDEIWAYGFRNPYRFSFDAEGDHELLVADAGQNLWEEVSLVTKGGNYGWNVKEGSHCFSPATPNEPPEACPETDPEGRPLIDPIIEYRNANAADGLGLAVVGGHVYRGDALPGFEARYVFGDWSRSFSQGDGSLFVASRLEAQGSMWQFEELHIATSDDGRLGEFLLALGQDARYELYALTSQTPGPTPEGGRIYRIVKAE
ncbi:MAG: PQQ-dependent sugar dehydrogenase, partial [Chloroflexota bacterium]